MNSWIFEYTNFLLISHNCVIIPGLGGFIRNNTLSIFGKSGLLAPYETVIFNPDLDHDDGLLVSLCQNKDMLSYDHASRKVKNAVDGIKIKLNNNENIDCFNLGYLSLTTDKTIIFRPNYLYLHPNTWGLSNLNLNPLDAILLNDNLIISPPIRPSKRISNYVAAAIALILFFLISPIDITNNHNRKSIEDQQANFVLSLKNSLLPSIETTTSPKNDISAETANSETQAKQIPQRTYYIIIGSETSETGAKRLLNKLKKDFSNIGIINSNGRYRLYIETFDDKKNAEYYLDTFRSKNLQYETAWILSLKNTKI